MSIFPIDIRVKLTYFTDGGKYRKNAREGNCHRAVSNGRTPTDRERTENVYTLCPLFFAGTALVKDNRREAKRLPYRQILFYHLRGGGSPPANNVLTHIVKYLARLRLCSM